MVGRCTAAPAAASFCKGMTANQDGAKLDRLVSLSSQLQGAEIVCVLCEARTWSLMKIRYPLLLCHRWGLMFTPLPFTQPLIPRFLSLTRAFLASVLSVLDKVIEEQEHGTAPVLGMEQLYSRRAGWVEGWWGAAADC
jgi:hypothetical protein